MDKRKKLYRKLKNSSSEQYALFGFLIGLFGTYFFVDKFYSIMGCIDFFGIHFHHLYVGFIIFAISGIFYLKHPSKTDIIHKLWNFMIHFGLGMMFDDILSHFILRVDEFEFFVGSRC
jgi:hypothetical protein